MIPHIRCSWSLLAMRLVFDLELIFAVDQDFEELAFEPRALQRDAMAGEGDLRGEHRDFRARDRVHRFEDVLDGGTAGFEEELLFGEKLLGERALLLRGRDLNLGL